MCESWNTHYIRSSRYHMIPGTPNEMFYLPESVGTIDHLHASMELRVQQVISGIGSPLVDEELCQDLCQDLCQEYFSQTSNSLGLQKPQSWQEALHTYKQLRLTAN